MQMTYFGHKSWFWSTMFARTKETIYRIAAMYAMLCSNESQTNVLLQVVRRRVSDGLHDTLLSTIFAELARSLFSPIVQALFI